VNSLSKIAAFGIALLVALYVPASTLAAGGADASAQMAEPAAKAAPAAPISILAGAAFGAGLVIIGAGYAFGKIGSCAVESMARQPEVAGNIQTAMLITAAMLEGVTFFALIVCISKQ